jgi:hypothetical protein
MVKVERMKKLNDKYNIQNTADTPDIMDKRNAISLSELALKYKFDESRPEV